jgi:hypothetical protein
MSRTISGWGKRKMIEMVPAMFFEDSYPFCVLSQQLKTRDNMLGHASGS